MSFFETDPSCILIGNGCFLAEPTCKRFVTQILYSLIKVQITETIVIKYGKTSRFILFFDKGIQYFVFNLKKNKQN